MNKAEYQKYLESAHWKRLRAAWRSQDRNKFCWICGSDENLNTHHRRYQRSGESVLYNEKESHLSTLCRECHVTWHKYFSINRIFKRSVAAKIIGLMEVFRFNKDDAFRIVSQPELFKEYSETVALWKKDHWDEIVKVFKKRTTKRVSFSV